MIDTQQPVVTDALRALAICRSEHPDYEYRLDTKRETIAANYKGQWVRVAALTITGQWIAMKYDMLVNGQRLPFTPDTTV